MYDKIKESDKYTYINYKLLKVDTVFISSVIVWKIISMEVGSEGKYIRRKDDKRMGILAEILNWQNLIVKPSLASENKPTYSILIQSILYIR